MKDLMGDKEYVKITISQIPESPAKIAIPEIQVEKEEEKISERKVEEEPKECEPEWIGNDKYNELCNKKWVPKNGE